jgi:methyltransferase (TIGR00027 family)
VAVDLRSDWKQSLRSKGFIPDRPTAWLAEGLLPYLPVEAQQSLFHMVDALSAPGSTIAFDAPPDNDPASLTTSPVFKALMTSLGVDVGKEWLNDARVDNTAWLAVRGWRINSETFDTAASRYGCPLPPDPVVGRGTLFTAHLTTSLDELSTTRIGGANA